MRRHQIEKPGDDVGIERAHFRRAIGRGDDRETGRMLRQHDFEQLPVEALRARLDFIQIEPRLDVEIIGASAVLEIEIDQAGRVFAARAAVEQQHCGLHRERGHAGAADRGQEGENLRFGGRAGGWRFGDPRTGAHQLDRRHRLDQEIGHPHLHQAAGDALLEALRDRHYRRPIADPQHQALERQQFGGIAGIDVDDDDGCAFKRDAVGAAGQCSRDHIERDLRTGAERAADGVLECRVGGQDDHPRLHRWNCGSAGAHVSDSHDCVICRRRWRRHRRSRYRLPLARYPAPSCPSTFRSAPAVPRRSTDRGRPVG